MKKKMIAILMTSALIAGALAGCGGGSSSNEPDTKAASTSSASSTSTAAPAATTESAAKADTSSGSEGMSVEEFLDTLTLGYAGASTDGAEVYLALDDEVDYGILGIKTDEGAAFLVGGITESGDKLTITDAETGDSLAFTVSEPASDETGDYVTLECDDGTVAMIYACDASAVIEVMSQLEDGTGAAASSSDTGAAEITAQDILNTLTLGFAGASEAGEELYLALDDNADYGIIGIVGDEATFLFGAITEDGNGLTMTDIVTGETLSFTVSQPQQDDTGTYVEVDFDGVAAVLYACDASAVIEVMSQY